MGAVLVTEVLASKARERGMLQADRKGGAPRCMGDVLVTEVLASEAREGLMALLCFTSPLGVSTYVMHCFA